MAGECVLCARAFQKTHSGTESGVIWTVEIQLLASQVLLFPPGLSAFGRSDCSDRFLGLVYCVDVIHFESVCCLAGPPVSTGTQGTGPLAGHQIHQPVTCLHAASSLHKLARVQEDVSKEKGRKWCQKRLRQPGSILDFTSCAKNRVWQINRWTVSGFMR